MTRKKVKLAYITNDSARKATFKKRKKGLMKKVSELSTLCGINACLILYSSYDVEPEVWPSPVRARRVLTDFKGMSEMDQHKKMMNQESFLRQRVNKATEQLKKQRLDNYEKEITQLLVESLAGKPLTTLCMRTLTDLGLMIQNFLKDMQKKIDKFENNGENSFEALNLDIQLNDKAEAPKATKNKSWLVELGIEKAIPASEDNDNKEKKKDASTSTDMSDLL